MTALPSPLTPGTTVRVSGPNIWKETGDLGRPGHVTLCDVLGDYGVEFDDDLSPRGSWFTGCHLEVLS